MLKKTITFEDLDGNPVTEDCYFNLSKAELAEMAITNDGDIREELKKIVDSKDPKQLIATFKKFLVMSYGRRSEDNKRFMKSDEISREFMESGAYSELFMQLLTDANTAAAFFEGILPKDLVEQTKTIEKGKIQSISLDTDSQAGNIEVVKRFEDYSEQELLDMTSEEFNKLVGTDPRKMTHAQLAVAMIRKTK